MRKIRRLSPLISIIVLISSLAVALLPAYAVAPLSNASPSPILINAIYYDTYEAGEPEEAFQLINISDSPIDITRWSVTDNEGG